MILFVYGTLRRGGSLYPVKMMRSFEFLGTYKTEPVYSLWDLGVPCLMQWGTTSVTGELYKVDWYDPLFHEIYNMERAAGYAFTRVELINFKYPTEPPFAFIYPLASVPQEGEGIKIESGDYIEYKKNASLLHTKPSTPML